MLGSTKIKLGRRSNHFAVLKQFSSSRCRTPRTSVHTEAAGVGSVARLVPTLGGWKLQLIEWVNRTSAQPSPSLGENKAEASSFMTPEVANMNGALEQMRRSGATYFVKSLPQSAIKKTRVYGQYAELTLPKAFVQENAHKFEEWVILRARLSCGRTSRPWLVRVGVAKKLTVHIGLGWRSFVTGNRIEKGDSLIFLLKKDARSEFEVHIFRGPEGSPHFPDEGKHSSIDKEEEAERVSDSEENEAEYASDLMDRKVEHF